MIMSVFLPIMNAAWLPTCHQAPAQCDPFAGLGGQMLHGLLRWLGIRMTRRLIAYQPDCQLL
jgi:hypothetical protein